MSRILSTYRWSMDPDKQGFATETTITVASNKIGNRLIKKLIIEHQNFQLY